MHRFLTKYSRFLPYVFIFFISFLIFWRFFIYGLHPFPGNLLLGWHEPWRSEYFIDGRIILPNKPIADDVFKQIYPMRTLAIDMMKKFEPPLWNPYNGAGMPLLATLNNGFLDPFNILFFVFPYPFAWSFYIIIQTALIGIFMYLYCRKILLSKNASLFTAIVFMLSGFVTVRVIFGVYGLAIALLPFILWIFESYLHDGVTKKTYLLPFALFALLVSTQPQHSLYVILFSVAYILFRIITESIPFSMKIKQIAHLAFFFLTGILLAAVQLLPTLELFQYANIEKNASSFIVNSHLIPLEQLVSILIPNYFGNASLYNYWGDGDYVQTVAALGLIPVFFAYLSFGTIRNKIDIRLFFLLSTLVTIALTIDWIGTRMLFSLPIPILSTGAPSRIFFLTTFSLSILSGYGFDKWLYVKSSFRKTVLKIILFGLLTTSILLFTFFLYHNNTPCKFGVITSCRLVALRNTILETGVFNFFLIPFFVFLITKKPILKWISFMGIFFIVATIGIYNANKFLPFSPLSSFFPPHPITNTLKQNAGYGRVFGFGQAAFTPNIETALRLFSPQYYHPLYILRYRQLLEYANNGRYISQLPRGEPSIRSESNPNQDLEQRRNRLLNILGVSHFIFKKEEIPKDEENTNIIWEDEKTYIAKNPDVLPRTYLANAFEVFTSSEDLLNKLFKPSFNPLKTILLEEDMVLSYDPNSVIDLETENRASIEQYSENSVTIKTNTNKDSILVLTDNYYPGWKAYIDGKETKIYRANYTLRAINLLKGKHEVSFVYEPSYFYTGLFVSIIATCMLGLMFFLRVKNKKTLFIA